MRSEQCPEESEADVYIGYEKRWKALSNKWSLGIQDRAEDPEKTENIELEFCHDDFL